MEKNGSVRRQSKIEQLERVVSGGWFVCLLRVLVAVTGNDVRVGAAACSIFHPRFEKSVARLYSGAI